MLGVIGAAAPEQSVGRWIAISQTCVIFAAVSAPIIGGLLYEISPYLIFFVTILTLAILAIIGLSNKL
jgi:MFS family permease